MRVEVLGAGVVGLSTALALCQDGHQVTVRAAQVGDATTSSVAAVKLVVGALVSPMTVKLLVAALSLPAASVSLTLNWYVLPSATVAL